MAATETLPAEETDTRTQRQPPYAVVLHNDDFNTMDFVIAVLRKVFGYTVEKCFELMLEAHETGPQHRLGRPAGGRRVEGRPDQRVAAPTRPARTPARSRSG